jgi:hypothetical protein
LKHTPLTEVAVADEHAFGWGGVVGQPGCGLVAEFTDDVADDLMAIAADGADHLAWRLDPARPGADGVRRSMDAGCGCDPGWGPLESASGPFAFALRVMRAAAILRCPGILGWARDGDRGCGR